MNKNTNQLLHFLFVLFLLASNLQLYGQDYIIPLWKDSIPNEIISKEYLEINTDKGGEIESSSFVSKPTLSVFLPTAMQPNGTAVLIFPGGGYSHIAINKEGTKVAKWLNTMGIIAFVLKYRLPSDKIMHNKTIGPLQDAQEAIRYIRRNAKIWNIKKNKIGVMGFSAGGHLAATISTHYKDKVYVPSDNTDARPDFSLLIYPVISMNSEITHLGSQTNLLGTNPAIELINTFSNETKVNSETPPTFLVHATDDTVVPVENSINYFLALKKNKVAVEMHLYEKGGHGFGLGRNETSQFWTAHCRKWLESHEYTTGSGFPQ